MQGFDDHFSPVAAAYAQFRPRYPGALFDWASAQCARRDRAWDCACGSGQATLALAERFEHVIATDASAAQIDAAPPHPRISWRVAPAERSGIEPASVDLVVVAQALHWFDVEAFYAEARRVARRGAMLVAWCYGLMRFDDPALDAAIRRFYDVELGEHWPAGRRHVDAAYRTLEFPAPEIPAPDFAMHARWSLQQLLGMLESWSAVARYRTARRVDPVSAFARSLASLWGEPDRERAVRWPLTVRVARLGPDEAGR